MNLTDLINRTQNLLEDLIKEAKRMDDYVPDDKKQGYRKFKNEQAALLLEVISELNDKNDVVQPYVLVQAQNFNFEDMGLRKIRGLHGKEAARAESLRRQEEFMEYQAETYGNKSKQ